MAHDYLNNQSFLPTVDVVIIRSMQYLVIPNAWLKLVILQLFAAAAPRLWNSLPSDIRQPDLLYDQRRQSLKTFFWAVGPQCNAICVNCTLEALLLTYLLIYYKCHCY